MLFTSVCESHNIKIFSMRQRGVRPLAPLITRLICSNSGYQQNIACDVSTCCWDLQNTLARAVLASQRQNLNIVQRVFSL